MSTQNYIRIIFFVSVLVFNPAVADTLQITTNIRTRIDTTITQDIASLLYRKGLEEQTAAERAEEITGDDAAMFALMLENLLCGCNRITKDEILDYLATAALHRQHIELNSYDQLIGIYNKIKQSAPDEEARRNLSAVARKNTFLVG